MSLMNLERDVVLASPDPILRERLRVSLSDMRWSVREANGGAEALAVLEQKVPEAMLVDGWLPDLEVGAFTEEVHHLYPRMDLLRIDGTEARGNIQCKRRFELLQALREATREPVAAAPGRVPHISLFSSQDNVGVPPQSEPQDSARGADVTGNRRLGPELVASTVDSVQPVALLPGLIGQSAPMVELARLIRLVAPHHARVLIQGETGTGKELVAKALHFLSDRRKKPFVVLNCAAIPEALLEAELFGHTKGAFTGAVQSRVGRIEAAHGGTLFLDEIGEMPLALQAKLLRFLENGELQRVGDNDAVRVDVRVIAATHRHLEECVEQGTFRLDLFHRLAVFPILVPSLRERMEDVPALVEHFLAQMANEVPRKHMNTIAMEKLRTHTWGGNIRELANVLQRAVILAGDQPEIGCSEIVLSYKTRR